SWFVDKLDHLSPPPPGFDLKLPWEVAERLYDALRGDYPDVGEYPGVLAWFVRACREGQVRPGLTTRRERPKAEVKPDRRGRTRPLTDLGNAERFVALHRGRVRYCPEWRKWLAWDDRRWQVDASDLLVRQLVQVTVRSISDEARKHPDPLMYGPLT